MYKRQVLYCYEESAIVSEALLCGCPIVFIRNGFLDSLGEDFYKMAEYVITEEEIDSNREFPFVGKCTDEQFYINCKEIIPNQIKVFINDTQKAICTTAKPDKLLKLAKQWDKIYIYGTGLGSELTYNILRTAGILVSGYIVSDEYYKETMKNGMIIMPVSKLVSEHDQAVGVVVSVSRGNADDVIPILKKANIPYHIMRS